MMAVGFALLALPLRGQETASGRSRVTISSAFGYMAGGPASGIEAMLEAGGFGDVAVGGCRISGCTVDEDFPTTASDPGPGSNLRISYSQWSRFEVALSTGTATPSKTDGYSQVLVPDFGRYGSLESKVRMFAATAALRQGPISIGVGPAQYRLTTWARHEDDTYDESKVTKVGVLLDGGAQFPMFKKVILELRAQYRFVGATDAGPLQFESRTLPATSVDFSHAFLGIGLGLAF